MHIVQVITSLGQCRRSELVTSADYAANFCFGELLPLPPYVPLLRVQGPKARLPVAGLMPPPALTQPLTAQGCTTAASSHPDSSPPLQRKSRLSWRHAYGQGHSGTPHRSVEDLRVVAGGGAPTPRTPVGRSSGLRGGRVVGGGVGVGVGVGVGGGGGGAGGGINGTWRDARQKGRGAAAGRPVAFEFGAPDASSSFGMVREVSNLCSRLVVFQTCRDDTFKTT